MLPRTGSSKWAELGPCRLPLLHVYCTTSDRHYCTAATTAVFAPDQVPAGYEAHLGTALTLRRQSLAANTAQINALRGELVTMEGRYPTLPLPVELVHGTADTIVPLHIHSEPLSQLLPNVTLTVIDGGGHMPHHSHSQIVIDAIDRAALR